MDGEHPTWATTEAAGNGADATQTTPVIYGRAERFASGTWALLLALSVGFAVAALRQVPPPVEPLTEAVMQATPVDIANVLLTNLGALARPMALVGGVALCLPFAGLVALTAPEEQAPQAGAPGWRWSRWAAHWAIVEALALTLVAPLVWFAAYPDEAASAWVVGIVFGPALWLTRRWHARLLMRGRAPDDEASQAHGMSRRRALRRLAEVGISVAGFGALASFNSWAGALGATLGATYPVRKLFRYTPPGPRAAGFPVAGVAAEVTPASKFYVVSKNAVDPVVDPTTWLLRVTGLVERPLTLTLDELMSLARVDEYVTLRCVDNLPGSHLMSNALWSGASLGDLLRRAGVKSGAGAIVTRAPDGYGETLPLAVALDATTLLAYGMNGETLERQHGGPVRLLAPGLFGFKNVKWVEEIEVAPAAAVGYWAARGWTAERVHSVARIDVWRATSAGALVAGMAYTGATGVAAVEIQVDGGAWAPAQIDPPLSPMAWTQWRADAPLAPGNHIVKARVIDLEGNVQPPGDGRIFPNGASGYDHVEITLQ